MAKILVVDDDKSIVDLLQSILVQKGYEVCSAMDGKEGLALAKKEKTRFDYSRRDDAQVMDGFTVSGLLFQDPRHADDSPRSHSHRPGPHTHDFRLGAQRPFLYEQTFSIRLNFSKKSANCFSSLNLKPLN